ncbi:MAG: DNA primase [Streptococcus sp.]|uniref:DNA primase n=1 Tax=Streptococcus sp. TaxID=1306 RepID=UPI0039969C6E
MTKADWLDFFEAINGRSATEEEIAAALAAGEFQDDAPAQGAPAQPATLPMYKKLPAPRAQH